MLIKFSPVRMDVDFQVSKFGDVLTINGQNFDFTQLPNGGVLPKEAIDSIWFAGDVTRVAGVIELTLILPHGQNPSNSVAFPEPIRVTKDGEINVPKDEVLND